MPKSKKSQISPEELDLFLNSVKGTRPLAQKKIRQAPIHNTPVKRKKIYEPEVLEEVFQLSDSFTSEPVGSDEFIAYKKIGAPDKILRKLRKGQYNIEAVLDLHGMTVEQARIAVDQFLQQCIYEKVSVTLIIHGKGIHSQMPMLKNMLNHWLRSIQIVIAFCSAIPAHGGCGATYVLLKKHT